MTAEPSDKCVHEHSGAKTEQTRENNTSTERHAVAISLAGTISEDPAASTFGTKVTNYTMPHTPEGTVTAV